MEITIGPRTKKHRAKAAMLDFHEWLVKMNNIHLADIQRMSIAYQKVYQSNIK